MIDVHAKLTQAFDVLPLIDGLKPNYKWGDENELNKLLKLYSNDSSKNIYPLIYNVSNRSSQSEMGNEASVNISLIIATRNKNTDWHNGNRWATSYKNVLFPMIRNMVQLFYKSGFTYWDGTYELYEFPNYGDLGENKTLDIWDALRMDFRLNINNNCLYKDIIFEN